MSLKTYTHPQETWDRKHCEKMSKLNRGLIAGSASTHPMYGQTIRYNGGTIIDGKHYDAVCKPLPNIHDHFEFVQVPSWGTYIRKKK
jgi:hypothetical protein